MSSDAVLIFAAGHVKRVLTRTWWHLDVPVWLSLGLQEAGEGQEPRPRHARADTHCLEYHVPRWVVSQLQQTTWGKTRN